MQYQCQVMGWVGVGRLSAHDILDYTHTFPIDIPLYKLGHSAL